MWDTSDDPFAQPLTHPARLLALSNGEFTGRRGMVLGVDLTQVRTLVVKSRGHFRAAFDDFAPPGRILEVDCPGLTTPNLKSLPWRHLPRPMYPIDDHTTWSP